MDNNSNTLNDTNNENEQINVTAEISNEVDGLAQLQYQIPLSQVQLKDLEDFIKSQSSFKKDAFYKILKKHFANNQNWIEYES